MQLLLYNLIGEEASFMKQGFSLVLVIVGIVLISGCTSNNLPENDADNDGIVDMVDNCPNVSNAGQENRDNDGIGDACDAVDNSIVAKGSRLLSIDTNEASDGDYFAAFAVSKSVGTQVSQLSLFWDDIEISQGQYQDPFGFLAAADAFYHTQDVAWP